MAAVTIEIFGLPYVLSTDAEHGVACLVEAPQITSARFRIGDPVSSDQSCSARLVALPHVRQMLMGAPADHADIRLRVALGRDETRAYIDTAFPGGVDVAWIRSERVGVTGRGYITDPNSPFYQCYYIDIIRGTQGTPRGRYTLDVPDGRGAYVTPGALPRDVSGLWAVVRRHRAHHEPSPGARDMFYGKVSRVVDAGDVIELEIQSGIEELLETQWPKIVGTYPHAQAYFDLIAPGWPDNDWAAAPMFGRGPASNAFLNRLGPIWAGGWYPTSALVGAGPAAGEWPEDLRSFEDPPYERFPAEPDKYDAWRAVIVEGADGYTGFARPDSSRRDVTQDEYIPIALRAVTPSEPLGSYTYDHDATFTPSPLGDYSAEPHGWYIPLSQPAPMNRRTGRIDGGVRGDAEYRAPSVLRSSRYYRALAWRGIGGSYATPPLLYTYYVLGQLTWQGHPSGVTGTHEIDAGLGLATQYCVDLASTRDTLLRVDAYAASMPAPLRAPSGRMYGVDKGNTYLWPPEMWVGRKIRDTVFGDMWTMHALAWAPGAGGRLRPIWLADDAPPIVAHIGPHELRDRDATLSHDYALPLASVEISGWHAAPLTERAVPSAPGDAPSQKLGGADIIRVESAELAGGLTGRSLTLRCSPYHARDGLTITSDNVDAHDPRHIKRHIRETWRRVIQRFGAPVPEVTLRIDADVTAYPGDLVTLTIPAAIDKRGRPIEGMQALMLERGDDLDTGTAECLFLLTGWHEAPWDPIVLGPLGWWDRRDTSTLFIDSAGTTASTADGDPVGLWLNKGTASATGNALQTVSANRPILRPDGVEFGPSTVSLVTSIVSTALPIEMWVVATKSSSSGNANMVGNRTAGSGTDGACVYMIYTNSTNAQVRDGGPSGTPQTAAGNTTSLAPKQAIRAEFSQTEVAVTGNGTRVAVPVVPPMSANMPGTAFRIGTGGTSNWLAHEVFYFDRALSAAEAGQLRAYLEAKHGI